MKLKPTVALSISVIGLAAASIAYAAVGTTNSQAASKQRVSKLQAVIDQNQGGAFSSAALPNDWFKRITVSGLINGDLTWSNHTPTASNIYSSNNSYNAINVANANLFVDAQVHKFVTAHVGLNYWNNVENVNAQPHNVGLTDLGVDEGYVTFGDFATSGLWGRIGTQYVNHGFYKRFPISATFTQMLTQTRADALTVGFNSATGFNASAFVFDGSNDINKAARTRLNTGGVQLGYMGSMKGASFDLGVSYINNMMDTDFLHNVTKASDSTKVLGNYYTRRVGSVAAHVAVDYQNFDATVDYVTASRDFNTDDLTLANGNKAKPRALSLDLGYSHRAMGRNARVNVGYQQSWDVVNAYTSLVAGDILGTNRDNLPEKRYLVGYTVDLNDMASVALQVRKDKDYKVVDGGTGKDATTGVLRVSVKLG